MISCPVLIIQGSQAHGGLLADEEIERALTFLPQASVARMETVGHPLHTQEKEPVERLTKNLLMCFTGLSSASMGRGPMKQQ